VRRVIHRGLDTRPYRERRQSLLAEEAAAGAELPELLELPPLAELLELDRLSVR